MKRAIVSDIHGNLEALRAVLDDIQSQEVSEIYCLGDIVGYGPNPLECVDLVMEFDATVLGNHDQGALFDPEGFSAAAEGAVFWARSQLEDGQQDPQKNLARWDFLSELPRCLCDGPFMFVHGSARSPLNEYVFPEDAHNQGKMEKIFGMVQHYCFQGHTHVPGVFTADGRFVRPDAIEHQYQLNDQKCLINVGSVGQPRDGNPRSCYVIIDEQTIRFRRVEYPFEETAKKIYAIPELSDFLGDRLREGR